MVRIVNVAGLGNVANYILRDNGSWLVAKGINACTVVHVLGIVVDEVGVHLIVLHADQVSVPAPAHRDACIRHIVDGVMLNVDVAHITCTDSDTAPVFIAYLIEKTIANLLFSAYLAVVSRLVGQVSLQSFRGERATHISIHRNIREGTIGCCATKTCNDIIQTRTTQMLEATSVKIDILRIAQFHSGISTSQPSLIVQFVVVGTVDGWTQFVGFSQIHTSLQWHMTFL